MLFEKIDYNQIPILSKKMKSFFTQNRNIDKTAYMNWRVSAKKDVASQFWILADGYFETAILLIDTCLNDNSDKKADIYIFPILFNIVQGIELTLKAVIDYLYIILREEHKIISGHNIRQLVTEAISRFRELKKVDGSDEIEQCIVGMKLVQKFVDNIYKKTDDMAFARYPIDTKAKEMFYAASLENVVVDLEVLREQSIYVITVLDYITDFLLRFLDYLSEIKSEYGGDY